MQTLQNDYTAGVNFEDFTGFPLVLYHQGGGGSWGSGRPPPLFWVTQKLHEVGKNVARVHVNLTCFNSYMDPPVSKTLYPPLSLSLELKVRPEGTQHLLGRN